MGFSELMENEVSLIISQFCQAEKLKGMIRTRNKSLSSTKLHVWFVGVHGQSDQGGGVVRRSKGSLQGKINE